MSDWQPIETAPKDGTPVLAFRRFGDLKYYEVSRWNGELWEYAGEYSISPTHWMPLPEPPE